MIEEKLKFEASINTSNATLVDNESPELDETKAL
jgi:hypothetical protein